MYIFFIGDEMDSVQVAVTEYYLAELGHKPWNTLIVV